MKPDTRTCLTCTHCRISATNLACDKRAWSQFAKQVADGQVRSHLVIAQQCPLYLKKS